MNQQFILFLLLLLLSTIANALWFLSCPSSGYLACSGADIPFVVNVSTTVQNCIFVGCPQVRLVDGSLILLNVTFKYNNIANNHGIDGGAISMNGNPSTNLTIRNCKFQNLVSTNGGAIIFAGPFTSTVIISDTEFTDNLAGGCGGAICSSGLITLIIDRVYFLRNSANFGGALFYDYGTMVTMTDIQTKLNVANNWGGCIYIGDGSSMVARNFASDSDSSRNHGGFSFIETNVHVNITDLTVANNYAPYECSFYSFGPSTLNVRNALFLNSYLLTDQTHVTLAAFTLATFTNVTFVNCRGGYLITNYGSQFYFNGGLVQGHIGITAIFHSFDNNLSIINNVVFKDLVETGPGAVIQNLVGFAQFSGCQILNVVTVSGGIFCMINADFQLNRTLVDGGVVLTGDGGLANIYEGKMIIGDGVVIRNILCQAGNGGIVYLTGSQNVSFLSADLVITNYSAAYPDSTFAYLATDGGGIFEGVNLTTSSIDAGTIYVLGPQTAGQIINCFFNFFPPAISFRSDIPSSLRVLNYSAINQQNLLLSARFPIISVIPVGYFGNDLAYNPNYPLVIVKIKEVYRNASTTGESLKAIIDSTTNAAVFRNYDVRDRQAGKYSFQIQGVYGTLQVIPGREIPWPVVDFIVSDCDPISERYVATVFACAPVTQVSYGAVVAFNAVAIAGIIALVISLFLLYHFRKTPMVKANSYTFISLMIIGSILSLSSILINASQSSGRCMVAFWLENMGFVINLTSLIIKMFRLQRIFQTSSKRENVVSDLSDAYVMRFMVLAILATITYMLFWTTLSPSTLFDQYIPTQKTVYVNMCSVSYYSTGIIVIKCLVTFLAAYLAYSIKHVPSKFNETKMIGLACYNWVVFGTIIGLIVQAAIQGPTSSFVVNSISIIFPHISSAYLLAFSRIMMCIGADLALARDRKNFPNSIAISSMKGASIDGTNIK